MPKRLGQLARLAIVCLLGGLALYQATHGLRAFTTEGERRLSIEHTPRPLRDVAFTDQQGRHFALAEHRGKAMIVDFIYTSCPDICYAMGSSFQRIARFVEDNDLTRDVLLLSVSFDPKRDTTERRRLYAERFNACPEYWKIAVADSPEDLAYLMQTFGIIVIDNAFGGLDHNSSLNLVTPNGEFAKILDFTDITTANRVLRQWLMQQAS